MVANFLDRGAPLADLPRLGSAARGAPVSDSNKPDKDVVGKYVDLQAQTPCRKCKKLDWALEDGFKLVHGGERVGVFVVLGPSTDDVLVGAFVCKGCGNRFERPFYSRGQLAAQEFPAVTLDVRTEPEKGSRNPNRNGH
jgi:hypothetical protein